MHKPTLVAVGLTFAAGALAQDTISLDLAQQLLMEKESTTLVKHLEAVPDTFSFDHEKDIRSDSIDLGGQAKFWVDYQGFHLITQEGKEYFYRIEVSFLGAWPDLSVEKISKTTSMEWNIKFSKGGDNDLNINDLAAILEEAATGIDSFKKTTRKGKTLKFSKVD